VVQIATRYEQVVTRALHELAARPGIAAVLLGALPLCTIAGTDHERLSREAAAGAEVPIGLLPQRSLSDDWLGGYAAVLATLAEQIDLSGASPEPGAVAIVGHLMDRHEGDQRGNIEVLRALLEALGLEPLPIWLSGCGYGALREVRRASLIVSLPFGRAAAHTLASRLGVELVELALPIGLQGTQRWLERLGEAAGRAARARDHGERMLTHTVRQLEWLVPQCFVQRRVLYCGEPWHGAALAELLGELGAEMCAMYLCGSEHALGAAQRQQLATCQELRFAPTEPELIDALSRWQERGVDLLVLNGHVLELLRPEAPWVEWGYPSYYTHFAGQMPYFGYRGCLTLLDRLAEQLARSAY